MIQTIRWPAEWETHAATWMGFPCRTPIWTHGLDKAQQAFANVANLISDYEPVKMLVCPEHLAAARKKLSQAVEIIEMTIDDSWLRDSAPIWIEQGGEKIALDFIFNAWGQKFLPFDQDAQVANRVAPLAGTPSRKVDLVLEGGGVHSNGAGKLITTKECLLNPNRNPHLTQDEIEARLIKELGVSELIWLENGVAGDVDTDGHIDNIACFVNQNLILSQRCGKASENFSIYEKNRQIIAEHAVALVEIDEPEAAYENGQRVPLSYINFYIANGLVVVPSFGCKQDASALSQIQELFPERKAVALDANEILVGGGGIHCITMQQPL